MFVAGCFCIIDIIISFYWHWTTPLHKLAIILHIVITFCIEVFIEVFGSREAYGSVTAHTGSLPETVTFRYSDMLLCINYKD